MTGHPHKGKRSKWMSESIKPTIEGWYETTYPANKEFGLHYVRWWDGKMWWEAVVNEIVRPIRFGTGETVTGQWRGLAEKPE